MKSKVYIIAEAGVNHNGSIENAKRLVDIAASAGADAVKFQTFKAEKLVSVLAPKADYQKETTGEVESQFDMIKKLELDEESHEVLKKYAKAKNIDFLSSAFDLDSISYLDDLGIFLFKIPSGEITNKPYLQKIARTGKPVVLSTGMATLSEIEQAVDVLIANGCNRENITILHCNTEYPTPMQDVNLNAMNTIKNAFKVNIGYSDHTLGIEIPIAAVALGARVIEKHFTIDKLMEGPDHRASLDGPELNAMVTGIRNIEQAMGLGIKEPSESELKNIAVARKSIVALKNIVIGETLSKENVTVKRPGSGISPMSWDDVIGKKASCNVNTDECLQWSMVD